MGYYLKKIRRVVPVPVVAVVFTNEEVENTTMIPPPVAEVLVAVDEPCLNRLVPRWGKYSTATKSN